MTSMSCCVVQNGHTALDLAEREHEDATAAVLRKVNALSCAGRMRQLQSGPD